MSTSMVAKHYTRLLTLWPKDPLRPNLPFTRTIERHGLPFGVGPLPSSDPSTSTKTTSDPTTSNTNTTPIPSTSSESAQINALYSLLENRYSKKYPLSPAVLKPTSNPEYYDLLMEEIDRAPRKTWWQAKWDEWKMKVRFS